MQLELNQLTHDLMKFCAIIFRIFANYEYGDNSHAVKKNDMYHKYMAAASTHGMAVVNGNCFAKCVRVTYPKCHQIKGDNNEMVYRVLKQRVVPLPFTPQIMSEYCKDLFC